MPKFYCLVEKTNEVYEAYKEKLIASLQGYHGINQLQASAMLLDSTIDNPVKVSNDEVAWIE